LSIRGEVLPIGGVTAKVEAAAEAGIKRVIIPKMNMRDVLIEQKYKGKIKVIPAENLNDVLEVVLMKSDKKDELINKLAKLVPRKRRLSLPTRKSKKGEDKAPTPPKEIPEVPTPS
jgi:predicted ATP-dependent protease